MKKFIIVAAAVCAVIIGCDRNNNGPDSSEDTLSIVTVNDNGFTMADGSSAHGRTFATGDRIGLFAVSDGEVVEGYYNLCLTASGSEPLTWQASDPEMTFPSNAVYYAYWPYTETLPSSVDITASDAEGFFSMISGAWTVSENQSGEGYDSSDLLVGMAEIEDNATLNFNMSHTMGLVEIGLPGTVYTFTNTDYDIPDYSPTGTEISFDSPVPRSKSGKYLILVRPGQFSIECTYNGEPKEFSGEATAGNCTSFSEGTGSVIEHNLQIGDFFLADGNLLSKDAPASEVAAAHVIGIVSTIDPERIGEGEKNALGGTAHAIVWATQYAGGGELYRWYTDYSSPDLNYERDESEIGFTNVPDDITNAQELYNLANADIEGYTNYHLILTERAADFEAGHYPGFMAVHQYADEVGGPVEGITTGWFLPAGGQMLDAIRNLAGLTLDGTNVQAGDWGGVLTWGDNGSVAEVINGYLEKVSPNDRLLFGDNSNGMQIAAQASPTFFRYIDFGDHGWVDYICFHKSTTTCVRPMLAF